MQAVLHSMLGLSTWEVAPLRIGYALTKIASLGLFKFARIFRGDLVMD